MKYQDAYKRLRQLGLKEAAAIQWASYLTRDGRETTEEEVTEFVEQRLAKAKAREAARRARQPELLTTPEERFGGGKGQGEPEENR